VNKGELRAESRERRAESRELRRSGNIYRKENAPISFTAV